MKCIMPWVYSGSIAVAVSALWIASRFDCGIKAASSAAALGSVVIGTRGGAIEYQKVGTGTPPLMVHGSGGVLGVVLLIRSKIGTAALRSPT